MTILDMGFFEMIRIRTSNIENFIRSTYSGSIINLRINSIDVRNDLLKVKLYFCSQKEQEMRPNARPNYAAYALFFQIRSTDKLP